ncbi:double-strand break repair helicase AddA [Rhodobacterales bacterium LSUCC0031]|nr:double-strand break repair helicase AddA [Rhodobacterales bacterium LSUCC0031]
MNAASLAQIKAAAPATSVWLSANAGSGKTRVLTDRVARLLLQGVGPERILCLTYTKAAAMEMQNRLFQRLGAWAMMPDAKLRATLAEIGEDAIDPARLSRARTLFARAIEAPGGLKIQTIHSFCATVLRRFPLEAGVSPGFTEIDERVQARLIAELLDDLADSPEAAALDTVADLLSDDDGLRKLARAVADAQDALSDPWDWAAICDWAGIAPDLTEDQVFAIALDGGEADLAKALVAHLDLANKAQAKLASRLGDMPWAAMQLSDLAELEAACLTMSGTHEGMPKAIANTTVRKAMGADLVAAYDALAERVAAARPLRLGLMTARRTHALHRFAAAFLPRYRHAKALRGWLDFDDLIRATRRLLTTEKMAQWVLFRLDGGIDHILVDEAQDTSPAQWEIVKTLAAEFAAGEGARTEIARTIFVVGDKKQSIYSFQGADPTGFDLMRDHFAARLAEVDLPFHPGELLYSFRSSPVILSLVDRVANGAGALGVGPGVLHKAHHETRPGRVDLWPAIPETPKRDKVAWDDPQDLVTADHHTSLLANAIAKRIAAMIADGEPIMIKDERRAVTAGDILILVQRRSGLFHKIIAALKTAELPVAGVDRAAIAEPLAVKDLIALMRFLSLPEDDLSLATLLRSPICGWDEEALYALAQPRGENTTLWQALRQAQDRWPDTVAMLRDLRDQADFLRPYDLLARALVDHGARGRLIARLGPEAEDAIAAMLDQALSYEAMEVPSLTGFVGWLEAGEVTVKRDLAKPNGQIRVMTVHGAKGLEAPVVFLPDTAIPHHGGGHRIDLFTPDDGPCHWPQRDTAIPSVRDALAAHAQAQDEERNRLLYVAMTRAESWLIVAAAGKVTNKDGDPTDSWYATIADAMQASGAMPYAPPDIPDQGGLRLQAGDWSPITTPADPPPPKIVLPDWATIPASPERRAEQGRSPSDLGGDKIVAGADDGLAEAAALRRGRLIHLLFEHLPPIPPAAWAAAAPAILAREPGGVPPDEVTELLAEAVANLTDPALAYLFARDTLAEVTLTADTPALGGQMLGVIDRLIVSDTHVLAVDFKTNAVIPDEPATVPEGLLRQMGAYAEMLAAIYPARRIDTAILWTRSATLMRLPGPLVAAALVRAGGA